MDKQLELPIEAEGHGQRMVEACFDHLMGKPPGCRYFRPTQFPGNPWHGECLWLQRKGQKTLRTGQVKEVTVRTFVETPDECPRHFHGVRRQAEYGGGTR